MVLIGLLVVALALVVVGVVLASVGWLIASLAVSLVAAAVLVRSYLRDRQRPAEPSATEPAAQPAPVASGDVPVDAPVWVADGYPEYHVQGCAELAGLSAEPIPYRQAVEDGFQPCVVCNPDRALLPSAPGPADSPAAGAGALAPPAESAAASPAGSPAALATLPVPGPTAPAAAGSAQDVLVVDGYPHYHVAGCRLLLGHDAELIPRAQAVEDGFTPCDVCAPDAAASGDAAGYSAGSDQRGVWVVDGYPDYHRSGCPQLAGLPAEPIPHEQAVEDGFAPCAVCAPDGQDSARVWVVDGYPDYHRENCSTLAGLPAEPIPHEQAVEDGFAPCAVCAPDSAPDGAPDGQDSARVWVVDGYPDYHRENCSTLAGLPAEPIPYEQAVEDGFAPCLVCRPEAAPGTRTGEPEPAAPPVEAEPVTAAVPGADDRQVWVVDGYPEYHREGCERLAGRDDEAIAHRQAVEDGFVPCPQCRPDQDLAPAAEEPVAEEPVVQEPVVEEPVVQEPVAEEPMVEEPMVEEPTAEEPAPAAPPEPDLELEPEPAPEPARAGGRSGQPAAATTDLEVWVIDGRSRYHAADCLMVKGQPARAMPLAEAAADGFQPCSLCLRRSFLEGLS